MDPSKAAVGIGTLGELHRLLRDVETAMLVTRAPDGLLRARPMAMQNPADAADCDLWFVSADDSGKVEEIREDRQVALCCVVPDGGYISISAKARIDTNSGEVKRLWQPEWKVWFPEEPADGTIALLKLKIERAEYFDPAGGRARVLYVPKPPDANADVTADR